MLTIKHLVDFGNYLLSQQRTDITTQKNVVNDADLANFFLSINVEYTPDTDAGKSNH